ncbi:MAG: stage II sporulation protein M [Nanoarchaeota archaeon]
MKKKSKGFLQESMHFGWRYLKESRRYVYGAALFFFACIFIGFNYADRLTFLDSIIVQMRESVAGLRGVELSSLIFISNTQSAFFSLFLGMVFSVFSVFNILLNGTLIGYVLHFLWIETGSTHFWKLLPHGVFELPALFISWGLGIRCGWKLVSVYFSQHQRKSPLRPIGFIGLGAFVVGLILILLSIPHIPYATLQKTTSQAELPLFPALFLTLGFFLCALSFLMFFVFSVIEKKMRKEYWRGCIYPSLLVFLWYVLPLLLIAGFIEGALITFFN